MNYNKRIGEFGEALAKNFLIKRGYKIIDANVKISYQEIDLIVSKNNFLIFVEVKTRTSNSMGYADESITRGKLNSLQLAIEQYIGNNNSENIRLDLISIDIDRFKKIANIKHYKSIV